MIETCINAANKGNLLPQAQSNKFEEFFYRIRKSKGIKPTERTVHAFYSFRSPQGYLFDALALGLITKKNQLQFVSKARSVFEIEISLMFLMHLYFGKYRKFAIEQISRPIEERLRRLEQLSGVDFSELVNLYERKASAGNRASHEKNEAKRKQLRKEEKKFGRRLDLKAKEIVSLVKGHLAAKFAQPNHRARLVEALRNPRDELTNRDMDKLWKTLEAHDKWQAKQKPIPRKRPRLR